MNVMYVCITTAQKLMAMVVDRIDLRLTSRIGNNRGSACLNFEDFVVRK